MRAVDAEMTYSNPYESYWWLYVRNNIRYPGVANYVSLYSHQYQPSASCSLLTRYTVTSPDWCAVVTPCNSPTVIAP